MNRLTKCDKCGKESGELYCGHCREEIINSIPERNPDDLIPLLFWNPKSKTYVYYCQCVGCPYNQKGFCAIEEFNFDFFKKWLHPFDGDNIIKHFCA